MSMAKFRSPLLKQEITRASSSLHQSSQDFVHDFQLQIIFQAKSSPQIIAERASQVVSLMASKQYSKAVFLCEDILPHLDLLVGGQGPDCHSLPSPIQAATGTIRCSPVSSVSLNFEQGRRDETHEAASHHYVNDVIHTPYQSTLFHLYDHAFLVPLSGRCQRDHQRICSAVVLYNMGLSYHLSVLSGAPHAQKLLATALRLYGQALNLIESLSNESLHFHHVNKLLLAIVNNMGHIYAGFCEMEMMQACHDCILAHYEEFLSGVDFYSTTTCQNASGAVVASDCSCLDLIRFFSFFLVLSPRKCLVAGAAA
jgi:hypothetical protein